MPDVALDPLLERPRVMPVHQHALVVIRFHQQGVAGLQFLYDLRCDPSEVGDMPELPRSTAHRVGNRLRRIVWCTERLDRYIPNHGFIFLLNGPPVDIGADVPPHRFPCTAGAINRCTVFFGESSGAADMVGMFVGEKQSGNVLRLALDMLQAFFENTRSKADIDQDARLFAFDVYGVALTAAGEYGKF